MNYPYTSIVRHEMPILDRVEFLEWQKDNMKQKQILEAQCKETSENVIYREIARVTKNAHNKEVLDKMAGEELEDSALWKTFSKEDVNPDRFRVFRYMVISRIFGITFAIKLLERDSKRIREAYEFLAASTQGGNDIWKARFEREKELISLIDEEQLKYIGSVVLGLYDALVEFTGVLAGFTLALQSTRIIAVAALITGIAATSSMAASVYLSFETVKSSLSPIKSAVYTGVAYLLVVLLLVFPYFIFKNPFMSLSITIVCAVLAIAVFTYYSSVVQGTSFGGRFRKMVLVSVGVAALSFGISYLLKTALNIKA